MRLLCVLCLSFMLFKKKLHADVLDAMFETFVPVVDCNIHYFKIINAHYLEKKSLNIHVRCYIFGLFQLFLVLSFSLKKTL